MLFCQLVNVVAETVGIPVLSDNVGVSMCVLRSFAVFVIITVTTVIAVIAVVAAVAAAAAAATVFLRERRFCCENSDFGVKKKLCSKTHHNRRATAFSSSLRLARRNVALNSIEIIQKG